MSMKRYMLVLGAALLMAGCGSSVKLDDVPVEDRSGAAVSGADSSAAGKNGVTPVELDKSKLGVAPAGPRIVYFDYDSYVVKPEFQSVIEAHARHLKADKSRKVAIEGHTDERGGREYNLALGQKRAEAVRRALVLLGATDSQVEAVSFGKEKPAVLGGDEGAWSKNRRAEITYR
jgi:peptidoglycan-associated lipoprotein